MDMAKQAVRFGQTVYRPAWAERYDLWLMAATALLLALGLVMVTSSSVATADRLMGEPLYYFYRQWLYIGLGVSLAAACLYIPMQTWQHTSVLLLGFGVLLLVLVLVPGIGREVNGSMRWISLGVINFQPSELIKIFLPIYLAGYLVRHGKQVRESFSGFFKPIAILAVIGGILLLEPDYGAVVVLFATAMGMLFLAGVHLFQFTGWMTAAIAVMTGVMFLAPYRVQRLTTFLDPWDDPFASGFQLTQALIAVGRGEWFGVGLGNSVQKLFYLPEAHTDFLLAIIGEELGFVGMAVVVLTFLFIIARSFDIAQRAGAQGQHYNSFLAYGLGLGIGLQAFINIGVNLGLLPTKGLTLPLMSYGGSSMLANCLAVGLLLRIDYEQRKKERSR